jgi:hypothetical protein
MTTTRLAAHAVIGFLLCTASTAVAAAPPRGGRDHAPLQRLADARYGPGHVNVATDWYGCHAGESDPWLWQGEGIEARLVQNLGKGNQKVALGWYRETGARPHYPCGGVLFDGKARSGERTAVGFPGVTRLGFYFDPGADGHDASDPDARMLFTNRLFNPPVVVAPGAAPNAGDAQTLIFDVSPWSQPGTWLVWFPGRAGDEDDDHAAWSDDDDHGDCGRDDGSGVALEVTILHATPALPSSFGGLKQRYRR